MDARMLLFGDPTDFAIEAGVEPDLKRPSAVWGRMCIWCRGIPLGEINDQHCALYLAYVSFRELGESLDQLWSEDFTGWDDQRVWDFLDRILYSGEDDQAHAECLHDVRRWGRYDFLTNWGEQFDGYRAFILCPPEGGVWIIYRLYMESTIRSAYVSRAAVTTAIEGYLRWFEEQERYLGSAVDIG